MRDPDEVRLIIAGREIVGWTGVSLEMAVTSMADAVSVSACWDPATSPLRGLVRPFGYERVEIYVGESKILTGRVDKVAPGISAGDRIITLEARSLPGILVDCSMDGPREFYNQTLAGIAAQVAKALGVAVVDYSGAGQPIPEARAEYGQGAGDFIAELAAARNVILASGWGGELCLYSGASIASGSPVARLVEGEGEAPVLGISASFDGTGRFSLYRAASQFAGTEDIAGDAQDSAISVFRPCLAVASDTDADPARTAARMRSEAIVASMSISVELTGWRRPDGQRWHERELVTLLAPSAMLYREAAWVIAGVTQTLDGDGRKTALRLVMPETFSGATPRSYPWD